MLWLVVPLGVMAWIPWRLFSSQRSGLGTFLGWIDLNLIAGIERTVLRPFVIEPLDWTPASEIRGVAHRVRLVDPW